MKLTVLVDNNTFIDRYYYGEPGLSYYIEDNDTKILWDTGYSNVFTANAKKLNIDLTKVDKLIFSHGHDDHTGGLPSVINLLKGKELIAHTHLFDKKTDLNEDTGKIEEIGPHISKAEIEKNMKVTYVDVPSKVSDNIIYLGTIPRVFDFEKGISIGKVERDGTTIDDDLIDDSALTYIMPDKKSIFVITGCSHSGICNIIEYAKKVTGINKVHGVIGGFHLLKVDERLKKTIEYLKENNIELLYPCHCVALRDKIEMGKVMKIHECGVGLILNL